MDTGEHTGRVVLDLRRSGFRDVVEVGRYEYSRARPPRAMHSHGAVLEISYLERGEQSYVVAGAEHHLRGGDILVTQPGEAHGTGEYPEGKGVMFWMRVELADGSETLLDLPVAEGAGLVGRLRGLPRRFRARREVKETLYRLFEAHGRDAGSLQVLNVRNLLIRFLLDVVHSGEAGGGGSISQEMQDVMRHVQENLERNFLLEELAARAGLSVSRFKTRFKQEVGMPPAEFVSRQKIARAVELLRKTGMPVAGIASGLGFSSSQYFATAFRRYTGKTPSIVRREAYS